MSFCAIGNQLMDQHLSMKQGDFKTHYLSVIQNTLLDERANFYRPFKLIQKPQAEADRGGAVTPLPNVLEGAQGYLTGQKFNQASLSRSG